MLKSNELTPSIRAAYQDCLALARDHYENFPVASRFLPKKYRLPIAAIYAFARTADDIADEGNDTRDQRLSKLASFRKNLLAIQAGHTAEHSLFIALKHTIETHNLPIYLFFDLLEAFKQDVIKQRYADFDEVINYCRLSANPIGRLLLHLTDNATPENVLYSDHICTGLQLINFLQDATDDIIERNRCYFPLEQLSHYKIELNDIAKKQPSAQYHAFISQQLHLATKIFTQGKRLGTRLTGIFGFEIRLIIASGQFILDQLRQRQDPFERPTLKARNIVPILWDAFRLKSRATIYSTEPVLEKL